MSSLCRHPPQAFPPIHPRQMRDNVVLRNVRWRKRFSCLPLYNSLFYKKFYRDENPLTLKKETKAKTVNKTSLLSTYLCIHCSLSVCVLVSPIHLFIEKCDGPHLFARFIFWNCCREASLVWRFHVSRLRRWHNNNKAEGAGVAFPLISRGTKKENKFPSRQHQQRHEGTREGFQWLRDHISLPEDPISVRSIHVGRS